MEFPKEDTAFLTVHNYNFNLYGSSGAPFEEGTIFRRHSMPPSPFRLSLSSNDISNPDALRRVRSFKTTSKGVVNSGDILRKRSTGSIFSSGCTVVTSDSNERLIIADLNRDRLQSTTSQTSQDSGAGHSFTSSGAPSYYRVLVIGAAGVGKSGLIRRFMSSDSTAGPEENDGTVSVVLDGEESLIEFCEWTEDEFPEEDINVDAYVVVFSITDKTTYSYSERLIRHLRTDLGTDRSILLVANKTDLVRNRTVDRNDARLMATLHDCKYVETSASLNHQVDNLLVGILSQIRLKLNPDKLIESLERRRGGGGGGEKRLKQRHGSLKTCKSIFNKLLHRQKSLSCDNLYDL